METNGCTAFRKGLMLLPVHCEKQAKRELMEAVGTVSRHWFKFYADGKKELTVSKAVRVEAIFNKYGVSDPWGLTVDK